VPQHVGEDFGAGGDVAGLGPFVFGVAERRIVFWK